MLKENEGKKQGEILDKQTTHAKTGCGRWCKTKEKATNKPSTGKPRGAHYTNLTFNYLDNPDGVYTTHDWSNQLLLDVPRSGKVLKNCPKEKRRS